jgi:hypothetical protein
MNVYRLLAVMFVFAASSVAWFLLGSALTMRTDHLQEDLRAEVASVWGPELVQGHPEAWFLTAASESGRRVLPPVSSAVEVTLHYEPKQRGLLWHRTYGVRFTGEYHFANPTPVTQTLYVRFALPPRGGSFHDFKLDLGGVEDAGGLPADGAMVRAVSLAAGEVTVLKVAYAARGVDLWRYDFGRAARVRDFDLLMKTDFMEIDFPLGTGSPTLRERDAEGGWQLRWQFPDVIAAPGIGMSMPKVLNAGPVASRMAFFAPVSLLFFFAVLLIAGLSRGQSLHPMNYFFIAAGFFAFQLLFAYSVDHLEVIWAFGVAAMVSVVLVCGYVRLAGGRGWLRVALPAQLAYMVLFSYSFFFDGLTGLTITIGAVVTLAILMLGTARLDWGRVLGKKAVGEPVL